MNPWTVKQLHDAMQIDLQSTGSSFERGMIRAICGKEIRELAERLAMTRKLTPCEVAIAQQFGYMGTA